MGLNTRMDCTRGCNASSLSLRSSRTTTSRGAPLAAAARKAHANKVSAAAAQPAVSSKSQVFGRSSMRLMETIPERAALQQVQCAASLPTGIAQSCSALLSQLESTRLKLQYTRQQVLQLRKSCVRNNLTNQTLEHTVLTLNSEVSTKQAALQHQQTALKAQEAAYEAQLAALHTKLEGLKVAALQEQQQAFDTQLFVALEQQAEEHAANCKELEGVKAAALRRQAKAFEAQLFAALEGQVLDYEAQLAHKCIELEGVKAALEKKQVDACLAKGSDIFQQVLQMLQDGASDKELGSFLRRGCGSSSSSAHSSRDACGSPSGAQGGPTVSVDDSSLRSSACSGSSRSPCNQFHQEGCSEGDAVCDSNVKTPGLIEKRSRRRRRSSRTSNGNRSSRGSRGSSSSSSTSVSECSTSDCASLVEAVPMKMWRMHCPNWQLGAEDKGISICRLSSSSGDHGDECPTQFNKSSCDVPSSSGRSGSSSKSVSSSSDESCSCSSSSKAYASRTAGYHVVEAEVAVRVSAADSEW